MQKQEFYKLLKEKLNESTDLEAETQIKELESYGSLSSLLILQLVEDSFEVKLNPRSLRKVDTTQDLMDLIGEEHFS